MSGRSSVNYRDLVVEWATSPTLDDFLKTSGLNRQQARYHEKILRRHGVNLPELKPATGGLDRLEVAQLNSLINKHTKASEK